MSAVSHSIVHRILQEALLLLSQQSEAGLSWQPGTLSPDAEAAIAMAKHLIGWSDTWKLTPLQLVFDGIHLGEKQEKFHYWPIVELTNQPQSDKNSPKIPYPQADQDPQANTELWQEATRTLQSLSTEEWTRNFSLLLLILEKYGSYISFGNADVAFFDRVRATAAVAASLADNPNAEELCLVAGDLSGIQPFIYTIASDGALKSLRARSFYLELVTEEMTQQLLERLELPRTNVIYTGGGKSFLLAPAGDRTQKVLRQLKDEFNQELLRQFQGKVFLNLAGHDFSTPLVGKPEFAEVWEMVNDKLSRQKVRKFDVQIDHLLKPHDAHEPCRVCHRDDLKPGRLKPLGGDGPQACPTCNRMFDLGQRLYRVKALVRTQAPKLENAVPLKRPITFKIGKRKIRYHLFSEEKNILPKPSTIDKQVVYLINNWNVQLYKFKHFTNSTLLLLGNYGQFVEATDDSTAKSYKTFISAAEMCDRAQGIKRVGHLRMDVDHLGQIFAQGLGKRYTLPRLAGLSRQMSYFFKVYLNSLAEDRQTNFLAHQSAYGLQSISQSDRKNLLFIYAGGDDLFITGSWDELVEFAFDVYQSFRAYTGNHRDITLSGGISLSGPKYPLYQSADDAGDAEGEAKAQGRDRLTLFGQTFQWGEWLGAESTRVSEVRVIDEKLQKYIGDDPTLALFGVFPFVEKLQPLLSSNFPKSFTRNLLSTAQVQEQFLKQAKKADKQEVKQDGESEEVKAIRYFLHLPKIAYTLARLPSNLQKGKEKEFEAIRTSLKSPYNAPYFRAIATWLDLLNRSSY